MSAEISQKACVYASLILADAGLPLAEDKLQSLIRAAGLDQLEENPVEMVWCTVFAKALAGKDLIDMVSSVSSVGAVQAPQAGAGGAAAGGAGAAAAEEEKKQEEEEEESDEDMGFGGLF